MYIHCILFTKQRILADPFEVAFVETMYTIGESAGSVNVCVNLTKPQDDILYETVNVFVTDFPMSEYIDTSFPPASERTNMNTFSFTFFEISRFHFFPQLLTCLTFSVGT